MEKIKEFFTAIDSKGVVYYYIGEQCINKLNNLQNPHDKVESTTFKLVMHTSEKTIKDIVDSYEIEDGDIVIKLKDGDIIITLCEEQDLTDVITKSKFTANSILRNKNGDFIDYKYTYRNKKISSIDDVNNKLIRMIGNAKQHIKDDPNLILEAFHLMAKYNFNIEEKTLNVIKDSLELLYKIDDAKLAKYINRILLSRYAKESIICMNKIGLMNLDINIFKILSGISEDENILNLIDLYNNNLSVKTKLYPIEVWAIISLSFKEEEIESKLSSISMFDDKEISKIEWLISNWNILECDNYKVALYNSRKGIVKEYGLMCLRELVIRLCKIHNSLDVNNKTKTDKLLIDLCSRPYFNNQLHITDAQLMEMSGEDSMELINKIKDRLIYKFVIADCFPREMEGYLYLTKEAIEEVVFESML